MCWDIFYLMNFIDTALNMHQLNTFAHLPGIYCLLLPTFFENIHFICMKMP